MKKKAGSQFRSSFRTYRTDSSVFYVPVLLLRIDN